MELIEKIITEFKQKLNYLEKNAYTVKCKIIIDIDENECKKYTFNIIYLNHKIDRGLKIIYSFENDDLTIKFKEPNLFVITVLKELSGGDIEDTINLKKYLELNKKNSNANELMSLNYYKGSFEERLNLFLTFIYSVLTTDLKGVIEGKEWIKVDNWHPYK